MARVAAACRCSARRSPASGPGGRVTCREAGKQCGLPGRRGYGAGRESDALRRNGASGREIRGRGRFAKLHRARWCLVRNHSRYCTRALERDSASDQLQGQSRRLHDRTWPGTPGSRRCGVGRQAESALRFVGQGVCGDWRTADSAVRLCREGSVSGEGDGCYAKRVEGVIVGLMI